MSIVYSISIDLLLGTATQGTVGALEPAQNSLIIAAVLVREMVEALGG
jgi:hypothetical protein